MESPGNYKIQVSFDDQKNYKVERYNYFMDNFARKRDPKILEGTLTDGEFEQVRAVLGEARIFDMNDSYGFEKEVSSKDMGEVLTQVYLKSEGKEKYISIRDMMNEKLSLKSKGVLIYLRTPFYFTGVQVPFLAQRLVRSER